MSKNESVEKISDQNVRYVVQVDDNCNPQGEDFTEANWPEGSKSVRYVLALSAIALVSAAGYFWWQAALGTDVAEEAVEIIPIEAIAPNVITLEPSFSIFEEMAAEKGWTMVDRADPDMELDLIIALQLRNLDILQDRLLEIATPGNPEYGAWLSREEISELTSPPQEVVDKVLEWYGAGPKDYHAGGFIKRLVTVGEAEKLLNSEYYVFEHTTGQQVIRMIDRYGVDSSVAPHISFASPSIRFPTKSEMVSTLISEEIDIDNIAATNDDLDDTNQKLDDPIDPELDSQPYYIRTLYNITATGTRDDHKQAVAEFLTQIFSQDDQDTFYNRFYPKGAGTKITMQGKSIEQVGKYAGIETMLDTEYITVSGTGIETENWSYMYDRVKTSGQTCPFLDWILDVGDADDETVPKVFSVSYGDDETYVSPSYAHRLSAEFMKAGARGISILFASGDSGANCYRNTFVPDFPAGSPYVTSVGGTRGGGVRDIDTWRLSSGGFSNLFERPSWQESFVNKYMEVDTVMTTANTYKANIEKGRGFPDVSAMAVGYPVVCTGKAYLVSGTSCASPVFAGIIALLNDHLLNSGKPVLGFLNPWLYSKEVSETLVDVVADYSEGCTPIGWSAAAGWDPVTGLGYPNFGNLRDLL